MSRGKHIILYYKYARIPDEHAVRQQLFDFCSEHGLTGRILLAGHEGINGTLAGSEDGINAFIELMKSHDIFRMTDDEFKHSWAGDIDEPFPDLFVKVVSEIISTGGAFTKIEIEKTGQGYLTPQEFHEALLKRDAETIVIDVRNHRECAIGRFEGSLDPNTKTFADFPPWVARNKALLENKKVLMYCTGGIRCEKASAFIRDLNLAKDVKHLKGGIHRYMEAFDNRGLWKGKNFVFDRRVAMGADGEQGEVVGQCIACSTPYDDFAPECVCTVCREPVLVCLSCKGGMREFHCEDHWPLRDCYFSNLTPFDSAALRVQRDTLQGMLDGIAVGKQHKNRRRTLHSQIQRIQDRLCALEVGRDTAVDHICRNCGNSECNGACWGFWGLQRLEKLKAQDSAKVAARTTTEEPSAKRARTAKSQRASKSAKRAQRAEEQQHIRQLPSVWRDPATGCRRPPPYLRTVKTVCKGRWQGTQLVQMYAQEFGAYGTEALYRLRIAAGLIRVNGQCVPADYVLANGDVLTHTVHWHEPPVWVPERISVHREPIAVGKVDAAGHPLRKDLFVIDKPASVPAHACGPYQANTLTAMVEAQEGLEPLSLAPCHRLDKHTSGVLLAATDPDVSRVVQAAMQDGHVRKTYVARVRGRFPATHTEAAAAWGDVQSGKWSKGHEWASWSPCASDVIGDIAAKYPGMSLSSGADRMGVALDCPVKTIDHGEGINQAHADGKPAQSEFVGVRYDPESDTSVVLCRPRTGRTHQLRIHLAYLGFPIANDLKYSSDEYKTFESSAARDAINAQFSAMEPRDATAFASEGAAAEALCVCCQLGEDLAFSETQRELRGIWLHALAYELRPAHQLDNEPPTSVSVAWPEWALSVLTEAQ